MLCVILLFLGIEFHTMKREEKLDSKNAKIYNISLDTNAQIVIASSPFSKYLALEKTFYTVFSCASALKFY